MLASAYISATNNVFKLKPIQIKSRKLSFVDRNSKNEWET